MELKQLVKPFSYDELIAECTKQYWRLPTEDEAKRISINLDSNYTLLWIYHEPHEDNRMHYAYDTSSKRIIELNKNFQLHTYVIKLTNNEICNLCKYKINEHFDEMCYRCSRFYLDKFELKKE